MPATILALSSVVGMYAAFMVVGALAARRAREGDASALLVAGRKMPLWIAVMTMTATWIDGGYLLGTAEYTYSYGIAIGLQGGICFGISLILGGLFFAATMRRHAFTTLIDPFDRRFGKKWAAVLLLPAVLGELFWSGALLVAIGSTFGVLLDMDLATAILLSAAVVTVYTMMGGMWSVAYTDAFQLLLIPLGLFAALPYVLDHVGGLAGCWDAFLRYRGDATIVPLEISAHWSAPALVSWWDMAIMLVFGGIPWNCYFQRVLSCETPESASQHSILAGCLTILLTIPPMILGMAALAWWGPTGISDPAQTLPMLLKFLTPPLVMVLGLAAIIGAVTSSFSSSILSAGSMFSWNVYCRLFEPDAPVDRTRRMIRISIVLLGAAAAWLALQVQSVAQLWLFTGDLVFVLLFPQLVMALYDPKVNRSGSIVAFAVSLVLRLGGGVEIFGLPAFIPYPELFESLLPGTPAEWYNNKGATLFPVKTLAGVAGLVLLPVVSRLTARFDPPRELGEPQQESATERAEQEASEDE
ncbi:MAG: sodium:solute symporter family protein [Gemmataceae bacterium]